MVATVMEVALLILAVWGFFPVLADVKPQVDWSFDVKWLNGKWYPIMTANRFEPYLEGPYFAFRARASPARLEINLEIPSDGTCRVRTFVLRRSWYRSYESRDREVKVRFLQTDNDKHVVWQVRKGYMILLQLIAKKKEATAAWQNKLYFYAEYLGYNPEKLAYLRESDLCTDKMPREAYRP